MTVYDDDIGIGVGDKSGGYEDMIHNKKWRFIDCNRKKNLISIGGSISISPNIVSIPAVGEW